MTRESEIESKAKEYAKMRGWLVTKLMRCDVNGWPDCLFIRRGVVIFIEFKAPGEVPEPHQAKRHREIREHGVAVFVCDDLEEARVILQ